jgi:hypothetical protein
MYAGLLTALWFAYRDGFVAALGTQTFETAVMGYLDIAYHLIDLAVPLNNWREAHLVACYMTSWTAFQVSRHSGAWVMPERRGDWERTRKEAMNAKHLLGRGWCTPGVRV